MILYQKVIEECTAVWQPATHPRPPKWADAKCKVISCALAAIILAASCHGRYISWSYFIFLSFIYLYGCFIEMGAGTAGGLQTARTDLRGGSEWTLWKDVRSTWNSHSVPLPQKVSFSIGGSFHKCAIINSSTISMPSAKVTKSETESVYRLKNLMESHTT